MAKRFKRKGASLCLLSLGVATGCAPDSPPFKPRAAFQAERSLAREMEPTTLPALTPTLQSDYLPPKRNPDGTITLTPPAIAPATGPLYRPEDVRRMTLQEIIQRAVANNGDVRVAGYDPAIEQTRIMEAEGNFDPTFFTNYQYSYRDDQTAGIATPDPTNPLRNIVTNFDDIRNGQFQTGVRQNLESGGQIEAREQLTYTYEQPERTVNNPFYESQLVLEITQPILRNFGSVVNRARIDIARSNTRISVLDFRKQLEETLFNIEKTYWELSAAERTVKTLEEELQRTENTADILLKRFGQEVSRVQTSQAASSVEARRTRLIQARAQVLDLSYQLKKFMGDPSIPVAGPDVILPASQPVVEPLNFIKSEQIDAAMENRFDLAQQLLRIEAAGIVARVAKNNLLPALNLVGGLGSQGNDTEAEQSWYDQNDFGHINYKIGFQFEVPIGNRAAQAIMKRSVLQRQQAIDQYQALVQQASLDVEQALNQVNSSWSLTAASRQSRLAAQDALDALQEREARGEPLTPDFVNRKLSAQEQLATQEQEEAEAIASYQTAIAQLERAKGTLLRYNNVQISEQNLPFAYKASPMDIKMPKSRAMYPEER
ncbi:MAG TPA: TolC family protein [Tepidisphaeraceae bacterium]|jgi:outer membrane protein TolC|nr:TolC family protein [Tepidisphaeraceae bacterium]